MTEQIKSLVEVLESIKDSYSGTDNINAINISIRSLKAWDEVLNELEEERAFEYSLGNDEVGVELDMCILIINQKLNEVEE